MRHLKTSCERPEVKVPFIILRNYDEPDNLRPKCSIEELCSGLVHLHSCFGAPAVGRASWFCYCRVALWH